MTGLSAVPAELAADKKRLRAMIDRLEDQPLTEAARLRIMHDLAELARVTSDADAGIGAAYLLGRLRQLNDGVDEPPEFQALIAGHPGHPLAQLARVKLILRRLYALEGPPPAERLAAAEEVGCEITLPVLRSDFHLAMGDAYLFFGDQRAAALAHFVMAEQLGISSSGTRGTVLVQIGELARLTGDGPLAARSYRAFLADFPRDIRQQIVRDRLMTVGEERNHE